MPDSVVETGQLTEFWLWDSALVTPALVELAELLEVPIPSGAVDLIETSHRKTTGYKTYRNAPLKDGQEANLTMNLIPDSVSDRLCRAVVSRGVSIQYKIVLKNAAATWEITGYLLPRDYERSDPLADRRVATLKVKWTAAPTEAVGA